METKQEFLVGLRRALVGKISPQEVEEHVGYYDDYITAEMRVGRSEKDVLDSLGNPGLIAMSICDAHEAGERAEGINHASEYENTPYEAYEEAYGRTEKEKDGRPFIVRHPKMTIALIVIVLLLVLAVGIWLAVSLVSVFWPIIVTIVVAVLLIRFLAFIRKNW